MHKYVTDDKTILVFNAELKNADPSTHCKFDRGSNEIDESDRQPEKNMNYINVSLMRE
jgi:hypothetical protein